MQVEDKHRDFWGKYKEDGDVTKLAKITRLHHSTVSNILSGTSKATSTETVLAINKFYRKRKLEREKATQIDND